MTEHVTLYGFPGSLWSGKARSYLIKREIPFREVSPDSERYKKDILPKIGRWIIPVIEMPDGIVVQDGAEIIDFLEQQSNYPNPATVDTPVHASLGYLFELFGGEGLVRPAMHYRWNFDEHNLAFLSNDFIAGLAPRKPKAEWDSVFGFLSGRMRQATALFGVNDNTKAYVESAYEEFLRVLDAHFAEHPYLLGGRPTRGDYGLIAPLYAHLGRDPYPCNLMKTRAPNVFRWVERMFVPGDAACQFPAFMPELIPDDGVPDTLRALLTYVAKHYLPELEAHTRYTNEWLAKTHVVEGSNGLDNPGDRAIGFASFEIEGHTISSMVMPYRTWLLQRFHDSVVDNANLQAVLAQTGLEPLLALRTTRPVERRHHLEVWGSAT